jgi:hypothetical protein
VQDVLHLLARRITVRIITLWHVVRWPIPSSGLDFPAAPRSISTRALLKQVMYGRTNEIQKSRGSACFCEEENTLPFHTQSGSTGRLPHQFHGYQSGIRISRVTEMKTCRRCTQRCIIHLLAVQLPQSTRLFLWYASKTKRVHQRIFAGARGNH